MKFFKNMVGLLLVWMFILTGCSSNTVEQLPSAPVDVISTQAPPTLNTTLPPESTSTPEATPTSSKAMPPSGPSGPASVPVIPNASKITGKILSVTSDDTGMYVELLLLTTEPVPGKADFAAKDVGNQIKAKWVDSTIPIADPDKVITGELRYLGDEKGGLYWLSQVQ
jgi:hypothetical protein